MKWLFPALALSVTPVAAQAQTTPAPAPVLECSPPFTRETTAEEFAKAFGQPNVVTADLDGAEGSKERGTVLFPKDSARRLEIFWNDADKRRRPGAVVIKDRSRWTLRTADRKVIGVGSPIELVEQANGGPFSMSGFGWDMGGYATDWRGGALNAYPGGCTVSIRFEPDPKAPAAALNKVSGDKTIASSDPAFKAVKARVSVISIGWAQ